MKKNNTRKTSKTKATISSAPTSSKQIKAIETKLAPLADRATLIKINDEKDLTRAAELLSKINAYHDTLIEKKEKITKPLSAALLAARQLFYPLQQKLTSAAFSIRTAMIVYRTDEAKKKKEAEYKLAIKLSRGEIEMDKAIKALTETNAGAGSVSTDSGMVSFRTDKRLKVTNLSEIPAKFFDLNEVRLRQALLSGEKVLGSELEEVQIPVNYRR